MNRTKDSVHVKANPLTQTDHSLENNEECVRGEAEPILDMAVFPHSKFELQADKRTAYESVALENGDSLKIHNWGCEYYVLTFSFTTTKYHADTLDLPYWLNASYQLMNEILAGIKSPIVIKEGLKYLEKYMGNKNNLKNIELGQELIFDNNEIRSFVTLDRIEKHSDNKYTVSISFTTGPL